MCILSVYRGRTRNGKGDYKGQGRGIASRRRLDTLPPVQPSAEILRVLGALRQRLSVAMFLRHAARATLFFFGLLVVLRAIVWWGGKSRPDPSSLPYMLSWPVLLGAIGGLLITLLRRPSLAHTAATLDVRGNTRDRLTSALEFSRRKSAKEMEQLAVKESADWLAGRDLRPLVPLRAPRELCWIAVPLVTLALLFWHETNRAALQDAAILAATENVRDTERSLESLARKIEDRAKATDDAVLKKVADRLKESAAQLRAEANRAGDTQTAALREIAELEQLIKQLRQPQAATSAEMKALAQALSKNEATREAAKAMEENRLADAAKELEAAAKQPDAQKAEAALKEAVDHLARQQEQASKQIEQLQQQAGEQSGGEERQQLMQQLAQMLREMPGAKGGQQGKQGEGKDSEKNQEKKQQAQGGKPMSDEDLKKLLGALQQMKDQQQGGGEEQEGGNPGEKSGEGSGPVTVMSFGQNPEGKPAGEIGMPSGLPGGEKDTGTTKDPFGSPGDSGGAAKRQEQLAGQLGEGESLSALVPTAAGGDAKAARRYRELTEAAASAAEDAVLQENIPLGARFLIKRYFDALRSRE